MLSILVTYYNQEKYVERSLNSIFAQQLSEDFEVLVGDDGSQDGTCAVVLSFSEKYPEKIRLFVQPRDLNVKYSAIERASANRLNLLRNAKGDFVCFLDGDDEYCDFTWMQDSIDVLKQNKKLAGVAHNYCEKYKDGEVVTPVGIGQYEYITSKLYAEKLYTHTGTIVFRNSFNEEDYNKLIALKSFDDNDITFYFLNAGDLCCVPKVVYTYYQNRNSIWNSADDFERNLINAIDYEIVKKILHKHHIQLIHKYFGAVRCVAKNKSCLKEDYLQKYKTQCVKDGFIETMFNWNKVSSFRKISFYLSYSFCFFIFASKIVLRKVFKK